ncbi:reverse transcriptase domain-containing protein [Tanacetum coccineum]
MEDDFKPVIQPQIRLNLKVQDVVKNEIVKLLDSGLIYPNSSWVSPIHVVPKKGGMTVVLNDDNELIPSRTVTGWRVCIDYRFFQILITPEDQEKITITCPYGTFAYRRMPFGLLNAPATFQRCMTAIFHDMVEDFMEVFMDDFSVFDASDFVVGAVLGQRVDGKFKPIYYASKTLNNAQEHYTTIEKELLTVDAKRRLIRWVLLLQGFDIEIKDKRGEENLVAYHLSKTLKTRVRYFMEGEGSADRISSSDEHLMALKTKNKTIMMNHGMQIMLMISLEKLCLRIGHLKEEEDFSLK